MDKWFWIPQTWQINSKLIVLKRTMFDFAQGLATFIWDGGGFLKFPVLYNTVFLSSWYFFRKSNMFEWIPVEIWNSDFLDLLKRSIFNKIYPFPNLRATQIRSYGWLYNLILSKIPFPRGWKWKKESDAQAGFFNSKNIIIKKDCIIMMDQKISRIEIPNNNRVLMPSTHSVLSVPIVLRP